MDSEILFWLFLAAIYILQALASKRKKPGQPTAERAGDSSSDMPSELEEALGEIGRVLRGDVDPEPKMEPEPAPRPSSKPTRSLPEPHYQVEQERPAERLSPLPRRSSTPVPLEPLDLGGRLAESPIFYDQAFEDQTADTFKKPIITHDHTYAFSDPNKPRIEHPQVKRPNLRNHMVSRQSFIAAELLAPPLSKRGRKR